MQDQLGTSRAAVRSRCERRANQLDFVHAAVSGYFAITATLSAAGGTLPQAGTRPVGIATFGVLPNLSAVVPAVTYAHQEQHRFGMQGFNDNGPMLADLGIS